MQTQLGIVALLCVASLGAAVAVLYRVYSRSHLIGGLGVAESKIKEVTADLDACRRGVQEGRDRLLSAVTSFVKWCNDERLRSIPIRNLRSYGASGARWSALEDAGLRTVFDAVGLPSGRIMAIHGIGPVTAGKIAEAAKALKLEIERRPVSPPAFPFDPPPAFRCLQAALEFREVTQANAALTEDLDREISVAVREVRSIAQRLGFNEWLFRRGAFREGTAERRAYEEAMGRAMSWLEGDQVRLIRGVLGTIEGARHSSRESVFAAYREKPRMYDALIEGVLRRGIAEFSKEEPTFPSRHDPVGATAYVTRETIRDSRPDVVNVPIVASQDILVAPPPGPDLIAPRAPAGPPMDVASSPALGTVSAMNSDASEQIDGPEKLGPETPVVSVPDHVIAAIKDRATKAHSDNIRTQDFVVEQQITAFLKIAATTSYPGVEGDIFREIKKQAAANYPDNYQTQAYVLGLQLEAYVEVKSTKFHPDVPEDVIQVIKAKACHDHRANYQTQAYVIDAQMKAYVELRNKISHPSVPEAALAEIKAAAARDYPSNYQTQLYVVKENLKTQARKMAATRRKAARVESSASIPASLGSEAETDAIGDVNENGSSDLEGLWIPQELSTASTGSEDLPRQRSMERIFDPRAVASTDPPKADDRWISEGREICVGGYTIRQGLIYFGEGLERAHEYAGEEASLINPKLKVNPTDLDRHRKLSTWFPTYADLSPRQRAIYLEWLAGGRADPAIDRGFVRLFFSGLERRALLDVRTSAAAKADLPSIISEIRRLLKVCGDDWQFRNQAESLLVFLCNDDGGMSGDDFDTPPSLAEVSSTYRSRGMPVAVKLRLGRLVAERQPIPWRWALAWLGMQSDGYRWTPLSTYVSHFEAIFEHRYREAFGPGIILQRGDNTVNIEYRPTRALNSDTPVFKIETGFPDVSLANISGLEEIADQCIEEFGRFDKYLRSRDVTPESPSALTLFPDSVAASLGGAQLKGFSGAVAGWLGTDSYAVVDADEVVRCWCGRSRNWLDQNEMGRLCRVLAERGVAIEPDHRHGGWTVRLDEFVVLFRLQGPESATLTNEYLAAASFLDLAAIVCRTGTQFSPGREAELRDHLDSGLKLSPPERGRLHARLKRLASLTNLPKIPKDRLLALEQSDRIRIAQVLAAVASANGNLEPGDIEALTLAYKKLGLPKKEVYSHLHRMAVSGAPADVGPVAVRPREIASEGFGIPVKPKPAKPAPTRSRDTFVLDMARVNATLDDTAAVATLLGTIFGEAGQLPQDDLSEHACRLRLDTQHEAFARALSAKGSWTRDEMVDVAAQFALLPDGALEIVNDTAFEAVGRPAWEGDDPIEIDVDVIEEMLS